MQTATTYLLEAQPLPTEKPRLVPLMGRTNGHQRFPALDGQIEVPLTLLPDIEVLALSNWQMSDEQHSELGELLFNQREEVIDEAGRKRLGELMQIYRRGGVRGAQALKVAIERGLLE